MGKEGNYRQQHVMTKLLYVQRNYKTYNVLSRPEQQWLKTRTELSDRVR
jgi:hypothetical protein